MRCRMLLLMITIGLYLVLVAKPMDAAFPTPSITLQPQSDVWIIDNTPSEPNASSTTDQIMITPDTTPSTLEPTSWVFDPMARHLTAIDSPNIRYEIVINLPSLRLLLYEHGQVIREYPIAVGKAVSQSLLGTTHIINKVSNPTYYPPDWGARGLKPIPPGPDNPVGTFWMGLEWKGYGIHGTNAPASIGTAQSAGCIRMYNADVEALGRIVPVNTPVTFVYEPVTLWRDGDTLQPLIAVYPDIYQMGMPGNEELHALLHTSGIDEPIHEGVLEYILYRASGKPEALPIKIEVQIGNLPVLDGYYQGDQLFVSLTQLSQVLGMPLETNSTGDITLAGLRVPNTWTWEQMAYAPLDTSIVLNIIHERNVNDQL
jgi:lipoprotein-anchoring transpeptidase ErfK/SrfK